MMSSLGGAIRPALTLAVILAIGISGFLSGLVVLDDESLAPLWLPAAVGLTVIVWFGRAAVPGLFIGSGVFGYIVASDWVSEPWELVEWTVGIAFFSTLQSVVGAWAMRRFIAEGPAVESARAYFILFAIAVVVGPIGPLGSVPGQAASMVWTWEVFFGLFINWWVGNTAAIAFLTPLLLGLRRNTPAQSLVLTLLVVVGLTVSLRVANSAQSQARVAWQSQARFDAEQVTGIFIRALQNGYGDMRALDLLLGRSGQISKGQFDAAIATLEATRDGFAPAALLIVKRNTGGQWLVEHASPNKLGLVPGRDLGTLDVARDAMETSLEQGLTLGGSAELLPGRYFGVNAIPAPDTDVVEPRVVVGIQDVNEIDAIIADQIPFGLGFAISSVHASGLTTEGRDHLYPEGKSSADALVAFDIAKPTGGAVLTFHWGVVEGYLGGPTTGVGRAVIFGGPLITLLLVAFLNVMFAQSGRIRRQVNSQTAELRDQREILQVTMDSMDQALLMVDGQGEIIAYNLLYLKMFDIDDELVREHRNFADLIRYVAAELGDPGLAEKRIREAQRRDAFTTEQETPDGRIIETRQNPVAEGGFARTYTDITERRRTEVELQRQTQLSRMALENMDEGLVMVDKDGRLAAYNQFMLNLFGATREEWGPFETYEDIMRWMYTEKLQRPDLIQQNLDEVAENQAITVERSMPDGRTIEVRHVPMADGGFVRMYTDVTERRQAAARLEQQKTIATRALENMGEGILLVDGDGKVAAYNQLAANYFGLTREEVDRFPDYVDLLHYIHTEKHDMPEALEERLKELESNVPLVNDRVLPNGIMLEVRHHPVEGGGFVRVFLDVTELREAEEELRRQKAISELALENMDNGLLLVDGDWQVAAYNPVALNLFGLTEEEAELHRDYEDMMRYIHREKLKKPELAEERLAKVRLGEAFTDEQHLNDGTIIEVRHYPMEDGGFLRMLDDVTERRTNEKKLVEAMKLAEDSARSKSEFLANMSHEIRTPMNAIIGMSHLALKTALTPKQHNYIDKVHRSAVGLLGIINDILDFSKIEAGRLELESTEFRLEDVLDNLSNLVGLRAEEKGLELLLQVNPDVPRYLVGDPLRLGQVLVNLGNNAVKFTDSGEIVVTVAALEQTDDAVKLEFSVRDTGIGMTAQEQGRLFRAFSQADASTTRKYGGTGLGLTISQRLVQAMQGQISVESEADKGSSFSFTVDLGWKPEPFALPSASELELEELRVLVVDDNPTARAILQDLVASLGFRVDLAASGEEALDLSASAREADDPYSVILMDWQMPRMDGVETTRALVDKGLHSSTQTLLMVTAFGREDAAAAGSGLPINSYLTKPLNASTLLDSILEAQGREAVSHRRRRQRAETGELTRKLAGAYLLLVEDNDINQELALDLLTNAGIVVDVAGDGQQALEKLESNQYDGVLMDIQMPVMDGYTATEKIRQQDRFRDLPVLAMTANALVGDRERALEAGMNDHIAKPLNVDEMFATMAKWITPADPERRPDVTAVVDSRAESDVIPAMEGIEVRAGLATCAGNTELYRKLLKKFLKANAGFETGFQESLRDSAKTATRFAHTLKGTAGSIGARDVAAAAASLEAACREQQAGSVVNARLQVLLTQLDVVLNAIAAADLAEAPQTVQLQTVNIPALATELRELLESADTRASDTAHQLCNAIGGDSGEALEQLVSAIESYDFEAALAVLAEVEKHVFEVEAQ